jgi:3-dehydroquinate synthetase
MTGMSQPCSNLSWTDWSSREINLGNIIYPYYFGYDCLPQLAYMLAGFEPDLILLVTDDKVFNLHGANLLDSLAPLVPVEVLSTPPGEGTKSSQVLALHLERAIAAGASRRSLVVSFGGGVPGNLAGLMAALLYRGIRLVHLPTTTMAAMDSTISLKQAINSTRGKNHIGTYHVPECVITDVKLMQTLPEREIRSGVSEAIKNCFALRPEDISEMQTLLASGQFTSPEALLWLLERGIQAKVAATRGDAREQKGGLILEYGHTIGHAVEMCDYKLKGSAGLSHGEAVALGMLAAAYVSAALCGLPKEAVQLHRKLLVDLLKCPATLPEGVTVEQVMQLVLADNKRGYLNIAQDEVAMVLLRHLGDPAGTAALPLVAVPLDLVEQSLSTLNTPYGKDPV